MKNMMAYKGYYGSVHFDDEELVFYGKVEFVRAHISYEATHAKGLKKAFQEAIDDYLAMCKAKRVAPEAPFKGSLNIRLGSDLHRRVAITAAHQHLSVNKFITDVLDKATN